MSDAPEQSHSVLFVRGLVRVSQILSGDLPEENDEPGFLRDSQKGERGLSG